jgi:peptide deformylase
MTIRALIIAPDPIFKSTSDVVPEVNNTTVQLLEDLKETVLAEAGIGIAAPMIGVKKRVIVTNVKDNADSPDNFQYFINPVISSSSEKTQTVEEGSLCFPYISANITRPHTIEVEYLDETGTQRQLKAEGFLAQVIQHEIDYLDGKIFLDYLSRTKKSMLLKKMEKFKKSPPQQVHGSSCNVGCCD